MQNIYQVLREDHRKVQSLMRELVSLTPIDKTRRDRLVDEIHDELIPHDRAEEAVFYNSIRSVNLAQDLVWNRFKEHIEAEALLRTLRGMEVVDAEWKKTAAKLQDALEEHIREEEFKIIPIAEQLFTPEEAEVMAEAFEEMKPEVREEGFLQSTLDTVASIMPARLAASLRTFSFHEKLP